MNIKNVTLEFVTVFIKTLVVTAIVTLGWNIVSHGVRSVDWDTSFRFALVFGLILPWTGRRTRDAEPRP